MTLDDFVTDSFAITSDTALRISFDNLAELLGDAEDLQRANKMRVVGSNSNGN